MKNNLKISLLAIVLGLIIIAGCKKKSASIVGTWTETTTREQEKIGANFVIDTTINVSAPAPSITFNANGTFLSNTGNIGAGTYTLTDNKLTVTDTSNSGPQTLNVITLTDNALSLQQVFTDTSSPYPTDYITVNFRR